MERLVRKREASEAVGTAGGRFDQFKCDKKSKKAPFGLEGNAAPILQEILAADESLKESVSGLMSQAKAEGTMENYGRMTSKFEKFCNSKGYEYPGFTEKAALHFVIQMDSEKATFALLCQIKPALALVEKLSGREGSAFSEIVDIFLTAAKRRAAESKPVVKKAEILPTNIMGKLYEKYFVGEDCDPVMARTFVRVTVIYFTFCRFNCYSKLRAMDLEDNGTSITVTFPSAKNDQYHEGQSSCLVSSDKAVDPVKIVRKYFHMCGFKFGSEAGDSSLLNCVIRRKKTGWIADGRKAVSYSVSTKNVRDMLAGVLEKESKCTDKSFKMLGVTRTLEAGTALEEVMHHGRWRTPTMPLHYKVNSLAFKEAMASNVPV